MFGVGVADALFHIEFMTFMAFSVVASADFQCQVAFREPFPSSSTVRALALWG